MAIGTTSGASKPCFSRFGIARNDIQDLISTSVCGQLNTLMQELREFIQLGASECGELRHPAINAPVVDDWPNQFTLFVVKNQAGTNQIGTSITAGCLRTMTEGARRGINLASSLRSRSIGRS